MTACRHRCRRPRPRGARGRSACPDRRGDRVRARRRQRAGRGAARRRVRGPRARPGRMAVSIVIGPKKFAEPVTLSSVEPTDLRLPPTAARLDFDLLALRARRKQQAIRSPSVRQEGGRMKRTQFARRAIRISPNLTERRLSGVEGRVQRRGCDEGDKLDFLGRTCLNRSRGRVHRGT